MSRFGNIPDVSVNELIQNSIPRKTTQCRESVWNQFTEFFQQRKYVLSESLSTDMIANILKDYAFNIRKRNREDYKESCIKTIWNTTAKLVQDLYFNKYNRRIDPFSDIVFKAAREARNTKRKQLQSIPEKRKVSAEAFSLEEIDKIINSFDEDTPESLQKKFFHIVSFELAWRGGEESNCITEYFKEEIGNDECATGRIIYNPIPTKICQGRLFDKLQEKRSPHITSNNNE
ncbi:hypothetical protein RN001_010078 [Aquatica leii]|uniref:Uncharacterized protein n=1 Tax=Aquatica leii TaxID=1421715 RepID=A0AAN7P621_9COLE|nr:hypothetical protein RN001_010078 [Aquatica leii]